jgi:hypothetical protein
LMMIPPLSLLALWLAALSPAFAQTPGVFTQVGDTLVSGMMLLLGNEEKVYILDKVEGNGPQINGHPAYASVWDIKTNKATPMDIKTNAFCASGMHLPNGSFVTFGGNGAIGPGGNIGSQKAPSGASGIFDDVYKDFDGSKSIRLLNPCKSSDDFTSANCQWFDDPSVLSMKKQRWYSAAEPLADGSVVLIGGFVNGGYVNRNFPNNDPARSGGAAEPTYEFFPARPDEPPVMQFMVTTSGLNSYAHTFLMPSGKMFVQANISTIMWDYNANVETPLPDMPGKIARVYPASGATAMLPLTPKNNYLPTIIFCGGTDMPADNYGDYAGPAINTWDYPASRDCQRITPEPTDGSAAAYVKDDDMLETRTMGQFIILPNGKMLVLNGALNGTAGYATATGQTPDFGQMKFGMSLAAGPVLKPAIYDPDAPQGSRWSNTGLSESQVPRLYHSSAILLPDASVLVAGSNPNVDVNLTTVFPTTYTAEIFYPPYFIEKTRPAPTGIPKTISYGGNAFDVTLPASSYSGSSNAAADNTTVVLIRPGFTTHAMNMGQRYLQLNNTYTVNSDGSIVLHVAQAPPNANLLQPGPVLFFVVVHGVPSVGTIVIVGNGQIGQQPTAAASVLPANIQLASASGTADGSSSKPGGGNNGGKTNTGTIVGAIVGGIAVIGVLGAIVGICIARRRRASSKIPDASFPMSSTGNNAAVGVGGASRYGPGLRSSDSSVVVPLQHDNSSMTWQSNASFNAPYRDDRPSSSGEFDPYRAGGNQPVGPRY